MDHIQIQDLTKIQLIQINMNVVHTVEPLI